MLETIISLDRSLFMLLNGAWICHFFDWFMPFITNAKTWMPIIIIVWFYMLFIGDKKLRYLALALLVSVGLADVICARIIKKAVGRQRPCSIEETDTFQCRLLLDRKSSKSFPSNHAANTAAFAATILFFWGLKAASPFILIAFLVGYSRIYCGVHFPADVMVGWLVGIFLGWATVKVFFRFCTNCKPINEDEDQSRPVQAQNAESFQKPE